MDVGGHAPISVSPSKGENLAVQEWTCKTCEACSCHLSQMQGHENSRETLEVCLDAPSFQQLCSYVFLHSKLCPQLYRQGRSTSSSFWYFCSLDLTFIFVSFTYPYTLYHWGLYLTPIGGCYNPHYHTCLDT